MHTTFGKILVGALCGLSLLACGGPESSLDELGVADQEAKGGAHTQGANAIPPACTVLPNPVPDRTAFVIRATGLTPGILVDATWQGNSACNRLTCPADTTTVLADGTAEFRAFNEPTYYPAPNHNNWVNIYKVKSNNSRDFITQCFFTAD